MDHSYFTDREKVQKTDHCYFSIARKTPAVVLRKAQLQMYDPTLQLLISGGGRPPVDQDHSYTRVAVSAGGQTELKLEEGDSDICVSTESCPINPLNSLNEGHSKSFGATPDIPTASTSRLASLCLAAAAEYDKDRIIFTNNWDYTSPLVVNSDQELWISALKRFDEEKQRSSSSFVIDGDNSNRVLSQNTKEQLMDVESIQVAHTAVDHLDLADLHVNSSIRMKRLKSLDKRQFKNKSVADSVEHIEMANNSSKHSNAATPTQEVEMSLTVSNVENQHSGNFSAGESQAIVHLATETNNTAKSNVEKLGLNGYLEVRETDDNAENSVESYLQEHVVSSQIPIIVDEKSIPLTGSANPTVTVCPMDYTTFSECDTIFIMEEDGSGILSHLFEDSNTQVLQRTAIQSNTIPPASGKELDGIDSLIRDISLDHPYDMCLTPKPHRRQCPSAYTMISERKTAELAAARMRQKMSKMKNINYNIAHNSVEQIDSETLIEDRLDVHCNIESYGNYVESNPNRVCLKSSLGLLRDSFETCSNLSSSLPQGIAIGQYCSSHSSVTSGDANSHPNSSEATSRDICESNRHDTYSIMKEHSYLSESQNINQRFSPEMVYCQNNLALLSTNKFRRFGSQGAHLDDHSYLNSKEHEDRLDIRSNKFEAHRVSYDDSCINSSTRLHDHTYLAKYNTDSKLSASLNCMSEGIDDTKSRTVKHGCTNYATIEELNFNSNTNREKCGINYKQSLNIERSGLVSSNNSEDSNEILWNMEVFEADDLTDSQDCIDSESVKSFCQMHCKPYHSNLESNITGAHFENVCNETWSPDNMGIGSPTNEVPECEEVGLHENLGIATDNCDTMFQAGEEVTVECFDLLNNSPDRVQLAVFSPGGAGLAFHSSGGAGLNDHSYHAMITNVRQTVPLSTMAT